MKLINYIFLKEDLLTENQQNLTKYIYTYYKLTTNNK